MRLKVAPRFAKNKFMNGIEDVIRWIDLNGIEFWKVSKSRGDKNDKVFEADKDETMSEKKARFRDVMRLYPGNYFVVSGKKSLTQTTGQFEYEFMNGGTSAPASVGSLGNVDTSNYIPKSEISGLVNAEIEKFKTEMRLQQLESENKELKKELDENGGAIGRMIKRAEPVLSMLIDRFIPARPAVQLAGVEYEHSNTSNNEEVEASEDENERIQAALEKWNAADPEFIQVLEFIANFAATGEKIKAGFGIELDYTSVKGMLIKK